jgi:hypothetical protein
VIRSLFIVLFFVLAGARASLAGAQADDFIGQIQPTLPANELLVDQITATIPFTDINDLIVQTGQTISVAEELQQQLSAAIALSPDDASRSRLESVLTHTQAVLDSLRMAQLEDNLDSARGRLDQARGEAQEGLDELQPFVVGLPVPAISTGK